MRAIGWLVTGIVMAFVYQETGWATVLVLSLLVAAVNNIARRVGF